MSRRQPIIVIGAGRAGLGLARGLKSAGHRIPAVVTRRRSGSTAVNRLLGRGTGATNLQDAVTRAGVILVCVPDREIASVVKALSSLPAGTLRGRVILHTSGAATTAPLAPLRRRGAFIGSIHPLVSFPPPSGRPFPMAGAAFALDGETRALREARGLVESLGGVSIRIPPRHRAAYHLVASLLANGLVALLDEGFGLARRRLKMTDARVRAVFVPLLATVLANVTRAGTSSALTGPVVRGDAITVRRHLEQLETERPELARLYRQLATSALRMALESKRLDRTSAAAVERVLRRH